MALDLDDPVAVALAAAAAFAGAAHEVALYGGLALAAYGEPRETRDADLAVTTISAQEGHDALAVAGIPSVIAFERVRFGGLSIDRLTLVGGGKLNTVDLVTPRSARFAAGVLGRSLRGRLAGQELRIVSPEDFVLLKLLSTREKDVEDARTIVEALRGRLDVRLMEEERDLLSAEITDHDIRTRYDALVR